MDDQRDNLTIVDEVLMLPILALLVLLFALLEYTGVLDKPPAVDDETFYRKMRESLLREVETK